MVTGTLKTAAGQTQPVNGRLRGNDLTLTVGTQEYKARVDGNRAFTEPTTWAAIAGVICAAVLTTCWLPETFEAEIRFTSTGAFGRSDRSRGRPSSQAGQLRDRPVSRRGAPA